MAGEVPVATKNGVRKLRAKYAITAWFYDLLDYPWERQYRQWRPGLLQDMRGRVLELGVGTGRNLAHYPVDVEVLGVDLSPAMLLRARRRAKRSPCSVILREEDATTLSSIPDASFDWVVSTFMFCVDRRTRQLIEECAELDLTRTRFLKADTYLLLEGCRCRGISSRSESSALSSTSLQ